jgi:hypothetical protein
VDAQALLHQWRGVRSPVRVSSQIFSPVTGSIVAITAAPSFAVPPVNASARKIGQMLFKS